jgi:hypothetical protein
LPDACASIELETAFEFLFNRRLGRMALVAIIDQGGPNLRFKKLDPRLVRFSPNQWDSREQHNRADGESLKESSGGKQHH